jgi:phosphoesterase RecJ-like protein
MFEALFSFVRRHESFILTTHDPADADGIGAELVFARVLNHLGKQSRIINASPTAELFSFMDPSRCVEQWDARRHGTLPEQSALVMLDTADEYRIGSMREITATVREIFAFDHHEPSSRVPVLGLQVSAASTCEMAVAFAAAAGAELDAQTALAAYAGIVYDTGGFAYAKTGAGTFAAAIQLLAYGVEPYAVYRALNESASTGALLLQKRALASLELHGNGAVAAQVIRKEDLAATGAHIEDAEGFVNIPLKARDIAVSILVKETPEGKVRCSLRSKGTVNVSKIAQSLGGGGHLTAAGFRSALSVDQTLAEVLAKVVQVLLKP